MEITSAVLDEAVDVFIGLQLAYRFAATVIPTPKAYVDCGATRASHVIRLLFSKPTKDKPVPEITVFMDLDVIDRAANRVSYAMFFEGQKYRRLITLPTPGHALPKDFTPAEGVTAFNEALIDKVFYQKSVVRRSQRWVEAPHTHA